jgi:hypothetical protein
MCMLGFFGLFLLNAQWLALRPLVGALTWTVVLFIAAFTGFVVGGVVSCLVIVLVWYKFERCSTITILLCLSMGVAAGFFV